MLSAAVAAAALLGGGRAAGAASACSGADPAITAAVAKGATAQGGLSNVSVKVTVKNLGGTKQRSNTLQSVDVFQDQTKVDRKGIPPLAPGQAYSFTYTFARSADARAGTTDLRFKLVFTQPVPPGTEDCNASNDEARVHV
jgi:hypothetical protein